MTASIIPARLALASAGTPYCEAYDDVYHSADGGLGQAHHVFLDGNHLPVRWRGRERFVILETGFGLGLNFLATWAAWRGNPERCGRLHFISIEKHPFMRSDLGTLHARWPELAPLSAELLASWPMLTPGFHRLHFDRGRVCLTLLFGEALDCLQNVKAHVDAFYLDGFAPEKNPAMWSQPLFSALARLASPDATLATWTVAASVRDGLAAAGFALEKRPGFGRKREMLAGRYAPPPYRVPRMLPSPPSSRRAVIIGAGPAGAAACERLASRGWQVELVERRGPAIPEAYRNLAGILHPMVSRDDNIASRLSRAGYLYALRQWHAMAGEGLPLRWSACGVLQIAKNPAHQRLQRETAETLAFPHDYFAYVPMEEAARVVGRPVAHGGWLFPATGWVNPPSLMGALIARHGSRVRAQTVEAITLAREGEEWRVLDAGGQTIAQAPVIVLANAFDALRFGQAGRLPLKRIRGQVTLLPASRLPPLPLVVTREGYVTPAVNGMCTLGATYDFEDDDPNPRAASNEGNLERLERLLPGAANGLDAAALTGLVGFRTASHDRMPLVGALANEQDEAGICGEHLRDVPRWPGLHCLLGYGSRGLCWAAAAAELLASQIEGEPLPLEKDLVAAVDPARFLLRAHRRGRLTCGKERAADHLRK